MNIIGTHDMKGVRPDVIVDCLIITFAKPSTEMTAEDVDNCYRVSSYESCSVHRSLVLQVSPATARQRRGTPAVHTARRRHRPIQQKLLKGRLPSLRLLPRYDPHG